MLSVIMINFIVTDTCGLTPFDFYQYIIQFETQLEADIWLVEQGFKTEQGFPFYNGHFECIQVTEKIACCLYDLSKRLNKDSYILTELSGITLLFFDKNIQKRYLKQFQIKDAENSDVETSFVFGFVD